MLRTRVLLVASVLLLALTGCGGPSEFALVGSSRAAGADGTVTIDADEFGNYDVEVEIEFLPPPDRLGDGLTTYVVWILPPNVSAQRAGLLAYDADDRTGHFRTNTTHRDFTLKITAERSPNPGTPSDVIVASRRVTAE